MLALNHGIAVCIFFMHSLWWVNSQLFLLA